MADKEKTQQYLNAMLDTFAKRAQAFSQTDSADDQLKRVEAIRDALMKVGEQQAALSIDGNAYGCPPGEKCVDGACVSGSLPFNTLKE